MGLVLRADTGQMFSGRKPRGAVGVTHESAQSARSLKARLQLEIGRSIKERRLTQREAGALLGVTQPRVSALMNTLDASFSLETLLSFIVALGCKVEIRLRPSGDERDSELVLNVVSPVRCDQRESSERTES